VADQLFSGALPSTLVTGTAAQSDREDPASGPGGFWSFNNLLPGGGVPGNYAFIATGTIQVKTAGPFTFALSRGDGARLGIEGVAIIVDDEVPGFAPRFGTVTLGLGTPSLESTGFQQGGAAGFELSVAAGANQSFPITTANGWHVLGDPSPAPEIN